MGEVATEPFGFLWERINLSYRFCAWRAIRSRPNSVAVASVRQDSASRPLFSMAACRYEVTGRRFCGWRPSPFSCPVRKHLLTFSASPPTTSAGRCRHFGERGPEPRRSAQLGWQLRPPADGSAAIPCGADHQGQVAGQGEDGRSPTEVDCGRRHQDSIVLCRHGVLPRVQPFQEALNLTESSLPVLLFRPSRRLPWLEAVLTVFEPGDPDR